MHAGLEVACPNALAVECGFGVMCVAWLCEGMDGKRFGARRIAWMTVLGMMGVMTEIWW